MQIECVTRRQRALRLPVRDTVSATVPRVLDAMLGRSGTERERTRCADVSSLPGAGVRVRSFAAVPAADNVKWLVPSDNRVAALQGFRSYSPFALSGRAMKQLLVNAVRFRLLPLISTEVLIATDGPLALEELVEKLTGECDPAFCVAVGTAGRYQKLTIQVLRPNGESLAFIKLPLTADAAGRIRHEADVLRQLGNTSLRDAVPRVLHDGPWAQDLHLLVISPVPGGPSARRLQSAHQRFLNKLAALSPVTRTAAAILDEVACECESAGLSDTIRALAERAIGRARRDVGDQTVPCGRIHGDFAPWNLRVSGQQLFSFDWESSDTDVPVIWDILHFKAQVAALLRKGNLAWTREYLESVLKRALLLAYVVRSLCRAADERTPNPPVLEMRKRILQGLAA